MSILSAGQGHRSWGITHSKLLGKNLLALRDLIAETFAVEPDMQ